MTPIRIAIIGLGLIGGSLGLALKEALGEGVLITGIDSQAASVSEARQRGAVDLGAVDSKSIGHQNIVFICTPVLKIVSEVRELIPYLTTGTIITDVGSTKQYLLEQLREIIPEHLTYIGGHPMAGREKSGIKAADKDLFVNKWYILSQGIHASPEQYQLLAGLIQAIGANVFEINALEHDIGAACMSHIPHVAAAALVNLLQSHTNQENLLKLMGGGFKDTTRIASSDAVMWSDICLTNKSAITDGLREYQQIIEQVISAIEEGNRESIHNFFSTAKQKRNHLLALEA